MTAPGVGTIVALTYASAIDDPGRFRSSKRHSDCVFGRNWPLIPKGAPCCPPPSWPSWTGVSANLVALVACWDGDLDTGELLAALKPI
jgi:hypothetical protein